jgi:PHD finger proteni/SET domain-containing protein
MAEPLPQQEKHTVSEEARNMSSVITSSLGEHDFVLTSSFGTPVIKCPCGNDEDDGVAVQCEKCSVWHHARCVGFVGKSPSDVYQCKECRDLEQDESIDVVMHEPLSSVQEMTASVSSTIPKGPRKKRVTVKRNSTAFSHPSSSNTIAMTEIGENIVEHDVMYLMDALKQELLRKPFASKTGEALAPYRHKNFEFLDAIRMERMHDLETALKPVEVKEVGHGRDARFAVYATEAIDPGVLVIEFMGQIKLVDNLLSESKKGAWIAQPFVLFPNAPRSDAWWETDEDLTLLTVDGRRFGNLARYIRRSCRPNMSVKVVCVGVGDSATMHFVLASSNVIAVGEELCLPLDFGDPYNDGLFFYDCACPQPELCLSPYSRHSPPLAAPKRIHSNFRTDMEPNRHTSVPTTTTTTTTTTDPVVTRKLTREERKMQRYIEFFEKMDRVEQKKEARKSGDTSATLKSRRDSTPARGMTSTESSSPPPPKRRSLTAKKESSPGTKPASPSSSKEPVNPKKAWLKAALQSMSQPSTPLVQDNDELIDVVGDALATPVIPKTKRTIMKRKPEPSKPASPPSPSPMPNSPEEPGEIVIPPSPVMTRPMYEDLPPPPPLQQNPQNPQAKALEAPHVEDRYARINRPTLMDEHKHTRTASPDRRLSGGSGRMEDGKARWGEEQGFEQRRPFDRRTFEQQPRRFRDEQAHHFPKTMSTARTPSNAAFTSRGAYSHQSRGHRFHMHSNNTRSGYPHSQHQDYQGRRMFDDGEHEEGRRRREFGDRPSLHPRTRFDGHFRGQSPPSPPHTRRQFESFGDRRSPPYPSRPFDDTRHDGRFSHEPSSRYRHQEEHPQPDESFHTPFPRSANSRDHVRHGTQQQ